VEAFAHILQLFEVLLGEVSTGPVSLLKLSITVKSINNLTDFIFCCAYVYECTSIQLLFVGGEYKQINGFDAAAVVATLIYLLLVSPDLRTYVMWFSDVIDY